MGQNESTVKMLISIVSLLFLSSCALSGGSYKEITGVLDRIEHYEMNSTYQPSVIILYFKDGRAFTYNYPEFYLSCLTIGEPFRLKYKIEDWGIIEAECFDG